MTVYRGTALQKKRAIRLLKLVVIAFAILLLPIHIHLLVGFTIGFIEQKHPWYQVLDAVSGFDLEACMYTSSSSSSSLNKSFIFSERELMFMFAICRRPSVCLSVVCLSVTFVHPTQPIEIFRTVSVPFNTLVT